jgi:Transglycosylase SLT domain
MPLAHNWSRSTDLRKPEMLFASGCSTRYCRIEQPRRSGLFRVIRLIVAATLSASLVSASASWAKAASSRSRLPRHVFHTRSYLASAHHSGKPQITTRRHGHAHEQSRTETAPCTPEAAAGNIDEILAAPPETLRAVREAVQAAPRLSPVLLLAIARAESRFAPEAQNRSSSARGLLQFTRDTWLEVMRQFGAQHGFPVYAKAIRKDQTGRLSVDRPATLRGILRLRDDPRLSAVMAVERLMQLCEALERELGRKASAPDLYFLHVLGPTGAARFLAALRSQPQSSSVEVVGLSAQRNKGLFIRNGCTLSVAQAYDRIGAVLESRGGEYRPLLTRDTRQASDTASKVLETAQAPELDAVLP